MRSSPIPRVHDYATQSQSHGGLSLTISKQTPEVCSIRRPLSIDLTNKRLKECSLVISKSEETYTSAVDYVYTQMQLILLALNEIPAHLEELFCVYTSFEP